MARLRTTVVVEYECNDSVVDERLNRLTPGEKADWAAHYIEHQPSSVVSAVTQPVPLCKKHREYKALRPPTADCEECRSAYKRANP